MRFSLNSKVKAMLLGAALVGAVGVVGGVLVPTLMQAAMASEPGAAVAMAQVLQGSPGKALDTHLTRIDGNYLAVGTEPGVSLDALSTVVVRKIGYGQTSFVTVVTTASGVYSTDGLASPNVQYPGIHVEPLQLEPDPFGGQILGWSRMTGWTRIPLLSANSFGFLDDTTVPASAEGVCVKSAQTGVCV